MSNIPTDPSSPTSSSNGQSNLKPPLSSATIRRAIYGIIAFLAVTGVNLAIDNENVKKLVSGAIAILGILASLGVIHGRVVADEMIDTAENRAKVSIAKAKLNKKTYDLARKQAAGDYSSLGATPKIDQRIPEVSILNEDERNEEPRRRAP